MKAPGKGFLQVCGILYVIFAGISLIVLAAGSTILGVAAQYGVSSAALTTAMVISIIFCIIDLVAGIIFIANCNKIENAPLCLVFAIITILLQIIGIIVSAALYGPLYSFSWTALIGFVLPILCLIGAAKNNSVRPVA